MTIALTGTIYVAHHSRHRTMRTWLADLFAPRHRRAPGHRPGAIVHVGITEHLPVLDPEPVTDSLNPAWKPFEPDRVPAHTYDELAAGTPVSLDWQPPTFTETWNAAGLRAQLDAEDRAAESGEVA